MTPTHVQCIDCQHFSLRGHAGMASQGYGRCALASGAGHFESATFERHCPDFDRVGIEISEARRAWLEDRRAQFNQSIDKVTP